jgi:hypothetical protein
MNDASGAARRRAQRLLLWYPAGWRIRYGDEFIELLIAEDSEQSRSWRRVSNVAWSGLVARLTRAGLTAHVIEPDDQARASLASLGCALAVFLAFGIAMWAQLTIGWQWAQPDTIGTRAAMVLMSSIMVVFVLLAVLAAIPIAWSVLRRMTRRQAHGLVWPSLLFLAGTTVLIIGGRHFGNGWPGTGGHRWAHQGVVPGGIAAFTWASTLSVTSYWAHPSVLASFPVAEVLWMVVSPVAMVCLVVGAAKTVRRLELSRRSLRFERWLGNLAVVGMISFLGGTCCWLVDGGPGPRELFHAGAIDIAALVVMAATLVIAHQAMRQARRLALG